MDSARWPRRTRSRTRSVSSLSHALAMGPGSKDSELSQAKLGLTPLERAGVGKLKIISASCRLPVRLAGRRLRTMLVGSAVTGDGDS